MPSVKIKEREPVVINKIVLDDRTRIYPDPVTLVSSNNGFMFCKTCRENIVNKKQVVQDHMEVHRKAVLLDYGIW
jgi:hypothetical protein